VPELVGDDDDGSPPAALHFVRAEEAAQRGRRESAEK
jgi:hypothetical protein